MISLRSFRAQTAFPPDPGLKPRATLRRPFGTTRTDDFSTRRRGKRGSCLHALMGAGTAGRRVHGQVREDSRHVARLRRRRHLRRHATLDRRNQQGGAQSRPDSRRAEGTLAMARRLGHRALGRAREQPPRGTARYDQERSGRARRNASRPRRADSLRSWILRDRRSNRTRRRADRPGRRGARQGAKTQRARCPGTLAPLRLRVRPQLDHPVDPVIGSSASG